MKIFNLSKVYLKFSDFITLYNKNNIFFQKYLVGLIIGFSSLPCNTSILFILNFLLSYISNTISLIVYIAAYFLGLIIPILLIFSFNFYTVSLSSLSNFWFLLNTFLGSLLFIVSSLSLLSLLF